MKRTLLFFFSIITLSSCSSQTRAPQEQANQSTANYDSIIRTDISKIVLLIADTSIIDPANKELPPLIDLGVGATFVDSTGKALFKPTQEIIFRGSLKDTLVDIFNNYLNILQDDTLSTSCFRLYRHVFILYDSTGRINEQINLCFDCTTLDYWHRDAFIEFVDEYKTLFDKIVEILKNANAYVPVYGPPPPPPN